MCEHGSQGGTEMVEAAEMVKIGHYSKIWQCLMRSQIGGLRPPLHAQKLVVG